MRVNGTPVAQRGAAVKRLVDHPPATELPAAGRNGGGTVWRDTRTSFGGLVIRRVSYGSGTAPCHPLTLRQVKAWVLAHHAATGEWPKYASGPIRGVTGETWGAVDNALRKGRRGLRGGSSVAKVVRECREASE